jgi:hypothetical protein
MSAENEITTKEFMKNKTKDHECCDGECNHDDCCAKMPEYYSCRSIPETPQIFKANPDKVSHCCGAGIRISEIAPDDVDMICEKCDKLCNAVEVPQCEHTWEKSKINKGYLFCNHCGKEGIDPNFFDFKVPKEGINENNWEEHYPIPSDFTTKKERFEEKGIEGENPSECEMICDHIIVWCGDCYVCKNCGLRFISAKWANSAIKEAKEAYELEIRSNLAEEFWEKYDKEFQEKEDELVRKTKEDTKKEVREKLTEYAKTHFTLDLEDLLEKL